MRRLLPLLLLGCAVRPKQDPPSPAETVLLLPGMGRSTRSLAGLGRRLEEEGYRIVPWPYRSVRGKVEEHGRRLHVDLLALDQDPSVSRIHIVGHSLGAIVARHALTLGVPSKMGRLVMIAPPNAGSRLARRMAPLFGWIAAPLPDLSDDRDSFVRRLGVPEGVEIGVIAASLDEKVRQEETHLPGEADFAVVPGVHGFTFAPRALAGQVVGFLRGGRFGESEGR
jgi:triacylglycerol lipase